MSLHSSHTLTARCMLLAALVVLFPQGAWANIFDNNVGDVICQILDLATGQVARAVGVIGILFLGIGAFFGKVNWGLVIMVGVGVAGIFGAATIAEEIAKATTDNTTFVNECIAPTTT